MPESLKKILKVYPLPIFVLLLTFVVYYSAFELLNKKERAQAPISQEESMQNIASDSNEDNTQPIQIPSQDLLSPTETETEDSLIMPQQLPEIKQETYLTSSVKSLNIRKNTNTDAPIVGKLTPEQIAISLEEKEGWVLLADSNTKEPIGWVLKRFTKEVALENAAEAEVAKQQIEQPQMESEILQTEDLTTQATQLYTSKVPSLNIRETPSTEARILNKLTPNDSVSIIESNGIWVKIQDANAGNKNGWVVRRSLILRD
ncbi:SH3 domain-containing protein [Helicobacter sp. MIT 11-5569]|uniref:SH3 domain-containing protein n=1 Tax=Helicobacter sp. MIT 11-5569 TaxID=1548151 RepID=UPI00051F9C55|nr:SH3 domain-containing protein [Helicobacter sp. MIT 11-5569]TLD81242.1 SH3 domain-containing protein [Helicobacter sp. MIT 11-5569]